MKFRSYPDRDMMMLDLANVLASELAAALRQNDEASFCVPGGTTPGPVFDVLSALRIDWSRVVVFASDERWVPETDARSNGRMIGARLLTGRAAAARYIPLYAAGMTPEQALGRLAAALEPHLPISVLLLGMGADMHTASLFAGAPGLTRALAADAPTLVALRPPGASEKRVSLTAPVLSGALAVHVVITGDDKRASLDRAMQLAPHEAPVNAVLANATVHWAA